MLVVKGVPDLPAADGNGLTLAGMAGKRSRPRIFRMAPRVTY